MSTITEAPDRPLLSIIIVSYNTREILKECLNRVEVHGVAVSPEVIVVDNASSDGSADMVQESFPRVVLVKSKENLGFAGGNNLGLEKANGKYILLLNSDAYLLPDVLEKTLFFMEKTSDCGVLGVKLIGEDGEMQPCARMLPNAWLKFLVISGIAARFPRSKLLGGPDYPWWGHDSPRNVGWVPGAYFLIRREAMDSVGAMDDRYFLYFEETDYCLQAIRSGWRVMIFPEVSVIHLGGESSKVTNKPMTRKGKQLIQFHLESEYMYYRKNYGLFHVFSAAGVEAVWSCVVIAKNLIFRDVRSSQKIDDAKGLISLIYKMLRTSRFGAAKLSGATAPSVAKDRSSGQ